MNILYDNKKVEKIITNTSTWHKYLSFNNQKKLKKILDRLQAAVNWKEYQCLGIGKPHELKGNFKDCFGISLNSNLRLIVSLVGNKNEECKEIIIEGVVDYHDKTNNWIIP